MTSLSRRCASTLFSLTLAAGAAAQPAVHESPLDLAERQDAGTATVLELDQRALEALRAAGAMTLTGFPLDATTRVDLEVTRFDVLGPDAQIVAVSAAGERSLPRPDVVLLRGRVAGDAGSSVFLGLSPHGTNGFVTVGGRTHIISSGPAHEHQGTVIYDLAAMDPEALPMAPFVCGTDLLEQPTLPDLAAGVAAGGGQPTPAGPKCRSAEIAIETDFEFTEDLFKGDAEASCAYATLLLGAVAEIFLRDFGTDLEVVFLRIWETADDPWDEMSAFGRFGEFRSYWNANMTGVQRDAVHFLSGIPLSGAGGIGYKPGLCVENFDYAISAHLNGFFPYPLEHNHDDNWDVVVVSHEIGHNFDAPHTHSMMPAIDGCGSNPPDCTNAFNGTIMSYCHTCKGGMANISLVFHTRIITEEVLPYLNQNTDCVPGESGPQISNHPTDIDTCPGLFATFTVVANGAGTLTYQWRKDGTDIGGAVGSTYFIASVSESDVGPYDVVVTTECGSITSLSAELTLTGDDCCPWDINGDFIVATADLLILLGNWHGIGPGDIDGNGIVATNDLLMLLAHWGFICI